MQEMLGDARFQPPVRVGGVKIVHAWLGGLPVPLLGGAWYVVQLPGGAWMVLCIWIVNGVLRLLSEWQLRHTLIEVLDHSPGGTVVVVRRRRVGGPDVWMQVGHGREPRVTRVLGDGQV
jgi:hypothetical protein